MENLPSILTPDLGLLFWMLLAFLVVFGADLIRPNAIVAPRANLVSVVTVGCAYKSQKQVADNKTAGIILFSAIIIR